MKPCASCQDPVEPFEMKGKRVDPSPWCKDCYLEKNYGRIPNVTGPGKNTPGYGRAGPKEDTSPWGENATRHLEDS